MGNDIKSAAVSAGFSTINRPNNLPNYVVAIGASAGGLEALEVLFSRMPLNTGMAFVVIQHLSPDYRSMMDELLARKTALPVVMAQDQMYLQANTIFLLPSQKEMMVSNDKLLLTERDTDELLSLPINIFFNSVAESYQDRGIAIVLSGTGSDGTKGIQTIHDSGGMVIAQSLDSCQFDSMPYNAIKTNKVDIILPPSDMPEALVKFSKRNDRVSKQIAAGEFNVEESQFAEILMLINSRFELDFSQYKTSTISRRIERRMGLLRVGSLKDYIKVLLEDEDEVEAIYFDLLIGVTHFFRDPEAFNSLQRHLPLALKTFQSSGDKEFRVWVPACATGEEAYSHAILLSELVESMASPIDFKIFATDVHKNSIKKAALGIYNTANLKGLSAERKKKFLKPLGGDRYQVNSDLRQKIVFAQHNIIRDAPFTKTHMISCRNLLIYFIQETQNKVLSLLTFALKNQGLLFLGPSETLGRHANDFSECDGAHKIYKKLRESHRRPLANLVTTFSPKILPSIQAHPDRDQTISVKSKKALNILLQRYVPPSLLINTAGDILHSFGDAGSYLSLTPGESSINLRGMVSGPAKTVVTQMLNHVNKTHKTVKTRYVEGFARCKSADISMQPLTDSASDTDYLLVSISPNHEVISDSVEAEAEIEMAAIPDTMLTSRTTELEEELQFTRESLQTTVEELETSNEELQSSNEELMAANEELQSTNEELQSVNEELVTVNNEYQAKEKERAEIAADEKSIVEASGIGILFLDQDLHIRKFSDTAARIFHLVPGDFNRPIGAISGTLVQSISGEILEVLQNGSFIEKEVYHEDGTVYEMRINRLESPSDENELLVRGVILTFINITSLFASQVQLKKSEQRFQTMVDALSDGYFEWKPDADSLYISDALKTKLGYSVDTSLDWSQLLAEESTPVLESFVAMQEGETAEQTMALHHVDGQLMWLLCKCRVSKEPSGGLRLEGQFIDMQEFKQMQADLQSQMQQLKRSNDILEEFAYIVSHDLKAPLRHSLHSLDYLTEAREERDEEEEDKQILALKQHLKSLQTLIDDVIRFSRFRTKSKTVSNIDLNDVIKKVKPILETNFADRKVKLHSDRLPTLQCDATMMQHLFLNILYNACKYNENNPVEINVRCETSNFDATINIEDNGIGFDQRYAEDIFKPFKRLVTKSQYEGSGVGLAICKTIVEQHGGSISARSKPGHGSQFSITLPLNP